MGGIGLSSELDGDDSGGVAPSDTDEIIHASIAGCRPVHATREVMSVFVTGDGADVACIGGSLSCSYCLPAGLGIA